MSNNISISDLQDKILLELPYTVSGNVFIEKRIFNFLAKVSEYEVFNKNEDIRFLMAGYSKIKVNDLHNIINKKWETDTLQSFFYRDKQKDNIENEITIYQYCLDFLLKKSNSKSKNITNIICDNNFSGHNIRIVLDDKAPKIMALCCL